MRIPVIVHRTPDAWHLLAFDAQNPFDWIDHSRYERLSQITAEEIRASVHEGLRAPYPPPEEPLG